MYEASWVGKGGAGRWSALLLVLVMLSAPAAAELYQTLWRKPFGERSTLFADLARLSDGGYVFCGGQKLGIRSWVVRTDADGVVLWEQDVGPGRDAKAVLEDAAGGVLVAGETNMQRDTGFPHQVGDTVDGERVSIGMLPTKAFVTRLDRDGTVLWSRLFGLASLGDATRVLRAVGTPDGLILLGARNILLTNQPTRTGRNMRGVLWLAKLDLQGQTLWEKLYDQETWDTDALPNGKLAVALPDGRGGVVVFVTAREAAERRADGSMLVKPRAEQRALRVRALRFDASGKEAERVEFQEMWKESRYPYRSGINDPDREVPTRHGLRLKDGYLLYGLSDVFNRAPVLVRLDDELRIVDRVLPRAPHHSYLISAVVPGHDGGYHIAGGHSSGSSRGTGTLGYLHPDGRVELQDVPDSAAVELLVPGADRKEVVGIVQPHLFRDLPSALARWRLAR